MVFPRKVFNSWFWDNFALFVKLWYSLIRVFDIFNRVSELPIHSIALQLDSDQSQTRFSILLNFPLLSLLIQFILTQFSSKWPFLSKSRKTQLKPLFRQTDVCLMLEEEKESQMCPCKWYSNIVSRKSRN